MQEQQKEDTTEEVIEGLQKQHSNKLKFLIIVFSVIGIIIFLALLISAYFYFKTPEKTLGIGANIESALLSVDGKISYLKLVGGSLDKNITKIKFIFTDDKGQEYYYETSKGTQEISVPFKRSFWGWLIRKPRYEGKSDYEINAEEIGLDNFQSIEEVSVSFEYKTETKTITTPNLDTEKDVTRIIPTTTPGGGGDGGTTTATKPTPTCTESDGGINYYEKGTTSYLSTTNEDYCNNSILTEYYCNNSIIEQVNYNCSLEGKVCAGGSCVEIPNFCTGIIKCSDYTNYDNCTINSCGVGINCSWNGADCIEGGSLYTSPYIWANGPSSDPSFFPIAVWMQFPSAAGAYKDIGVNMYVGLYQGPTESQLTQLETYGMPALASQNAVGLTSNKSYLIDGWMQQDEPDNAQWNKTLQAYDPCIDHLIMQDRYNIMKSNDSTRPIWLNFAPGVANEYYAGRGVCGRRLDMYPEYMKAGDIISFDIYPVNSGSPVKGNLEYVARGVERLVEWSQGEKIVWNVIETSDIDSSSIRPTPAQIKSEVWMSLIHGSMGIVYFSAEWYADGTWKTASAILNYPEIKAAVTEINSRITSLAPVLNSRTIKNGAEARLPIKFMVKHYNGSIYLFAVSMQDTNTTADFIVFGVEDNATAEVLDEGREITINNGKFQDNFDGYGVHLYKILPLRLRWYKDSDSDSYGDINIFLDASSQPQGYVINYRDCDDGNININPIGKETCGNGIDEDCSGADLSCPNLPAGYVSYWKFDEGSGMIAGDSAGKYDGSIYGADWKTGKVNSALNFNGIDDYMLYPDFPFINPPFTILSWAKWDGPTTGDWYYKSIISRGASSYTNSNFDFGFRQGANRIYFEWRNESSTVFGGEVANNDIVGKWGHIVGVVNSTYDLNLYVNGVKVLTDIGNSAPTEGLQGLQIGYSGHSSTYWNGSVDELVVFNKALNETEIKQIYCSQGGTGEVCEEFGTLSPLTKIWNFLKRLLTKK